MQYHAGEINKALKDIKPTDAYAILAVTNVDLYPRDSWNFVYGLSCAGSGTATFSFARYDPAFEGSGGPNRAQNWFRRSTYVMVHELTHLFGLPHCIYYECTMNGVMNADEQIRRANYILCPICIKKLKKNIGFNVNARFNCLMEMANKLGFADEAEKYRKLI